MGSLVSFKVERRKCLILGNFEDTKKSQSSEHRETERAGFESRPDDLENRATDDDAIEPIERRLEVDPRPEGVHLDEHLRHKQTEEGKLGIICHHDSLVTSSQIGI